LTTRPASPSADALGGSAAGTARVTWHVVNADVATQIENLANIMTNIEAVTDVEALQTSIDSLSEQASAPDLWNDQEKAQQVTSALSHSQSEIKRLKDLRQRVDDLEVHFELADEDPASLPEAEAELRATTKAVEAMEVRTLLSGEYDQREALVTIRSEAGGVDAADFAEMLLRMYMRWAERHGYPTEVYDTSYAEEAGLKSATFQVKVPYAYGTLSVEQGTHRLVRISPFDNQGRRQTSFAGVEVVPVVETSDHVEIDDKDIRVDVYRSSGPGGQGVNTTDSAVRITHLPTGIVVSCQNERSQIQNRASAMVVLQAKLLVRRKEEEKATMDALKDAGNSWGNQMRSYVLHPYQMVKDLRTEFEVGNPTAVFDGDIDGFIEAGIRWRRNTELAS
jgi:peptide chain release factor 2